MKSISWQSLEYVHKEKSSDWFWVLGILATAIAITSIIFGNILLAVIVAIGAFVIAMLAAREPNVITIEVNEKGIVIERTFYPFKTLKSFWVDDEHHHGPRLVLRSQKPFAPYVIVPINYEDLDELREFLEAKLEAEPFEESPLQIFIERLGF